MLEREKRKRARKRNTEFVDRSPLSNPYHQTLQEVEEYLGQILKRGVGL